MGSIKGDTIDFFQLKNKELTVNIRNSEKLDELYYKYARSFKKSAYLFVETTLESDDISKLDFNFFSLAFMYRHSIELLLKGIGLQYIDNIKLQKKFLKETFHNLEAIFLYITRYIEIEIREDLDEYCWVLKILQDINKIDKESDSFRYPFRVVKNNGSYKIKPFFEEQTHINLYKFANKMEVIFEILNGYYLKSKSTEQKFREFEPQFLEKGGHYYSQSVVGYQYSGKFYGSIKSYKDFGKFIYKKIINLDCERELVIPLIYSLRNMLELILKDLIFDKLGYKEDYVLSEIIKKKHNLKKLWGVVELDLMEQLIGILDMERAEILEIKEYIEKLHDIDGKADLFRYPTNKNLDVYFKNGRNLDIENIYKYFERLIDFFEYIEYVMAYKKEFSYEFLEY